jgi:hypothetical protein
MAASENSAAERLRAGLCINCKHMRRVLSERGSTFYLCERGLREPGFQKYPSLPVRECPGYEQEFLKIPLSTNEETH